MDRLIAALLVAVLVVVTGFGIVSWRGDAQAHDDAERLACLQEAQATAAIALLVPATQVNEEGRVAAVNDLGTKVDGC
jgi:hypothetical protein